MAAITLAVAIVITFGTGPIAVAIGAQAVTLAVWAHVLSIALAAFTAECALSITISTNKSSLTITFPTKYSACTATTVALDFMSIVKVKSITSTGGTCLGTLTHAMATDVKSMSVATAAI